MKLLKSKIGFALAIFYLFGIAAFYFYVLYFYPDGVLGLIWTTLPWAFLLWIVSPGVHNIFYDDVLPIFLNTVTIYFVGFAIEKMYRKLKS